VFRSIICALLVSFSCATVSAINLINLTQWKASDGGNNHWYGIMADDFYWDGAYASARSLAVSGSHGYLATITSANENNFIRDFVVNGTNQQSILDQFFTGGYYQDGSWKWITGESFTYTNWNTGEPNNNPGIDESRVTMWGPALTPPPGGGQGPLGTWNNAMPDRYTFWSLVEFGGNYPISAGSPVGQCPVPEPTTIVTLSLCLVALCFVKRPRV
jgi:hypothetical protein